jgi:hypothetical protein
LRVARRSRAERFYARGALVRPRAARSTRTLGGICTVLTGYEDLASTLEQLRDLLRRHDQDFWAKQIDDDIYFVRQNELYGVERFLTYFGGMGSLNDVVITQARGRQLDPAEQRSVNDQLRALLSRSWRDAKMLLGNAT